MAVGVDETSHLTAHRFLFAQLLRTHRGEFRYNFLQGFQLVNLMGKASGDRDLLFLRRQVIEVDAGDSMQFVPSLQTCDAHAFLDPLFG